MARTLKQILHDTKADIKENIKEGFTLDSFLKGVGKEIDNQIKHGAHELASALYTGSAFVMYPRAGNDSVDTPQHGLPIEPMKQPEQEQSRGGMEM